MIRSKSIIAVPPGATIKEQLVDKGFNQKEFAFRMHLSEKHVSKLINGEVQLTADVAMRLEMVLGVPAGFWNTLEANYREAIIKANAENDMDEDIALARKFPYKTMSELGWVPQTDQTKEKVIHLRKYFEVVNLILILDPRFNENIIHRDMYSGRKALAYTAWIQKVKETSETIHTESFNMNALKKLLSSLDKQYGLDSTHGNLTKKISKCGVCSVNVQSLDNDIPFKVSFFNQGRIIIGMSMPANKETDFETELIQELLQIVFVYENQSQRMKDKRMTADQTKQFLRYAER